MNLKQKDELFTQFAKGLVLVASAPNDTKKIEAMEIVQDLSYSIAMEDIKIIKDYLIKRSYKDNAPKQVRDNLKKLFPTNNGSIL
tara:strand:- start:47 stop:301 length:255 start_codon:yes stop_codon:yes gene_type:complete